MSRTGKPLVGIVMGSDSDWPVLQPAVSTLAQFGVGCEVRVLSAHRAPAHVRRFAEGAAGRGLKILIAAAGGAAHLAGVAAAHTTLPVIGVPIETKGLKGLDSLLSTVQMPSGVPVATVAINGAVNAGLLAVQCLAIGDARLRRALATHKKQLTQKTLQADRGLRGRTRSRSRA